MAGRLNDNEVAQEMNKMVAFIKQEALEKAREIKLKADEEFNIEKGKLVRQETVAIEAFFQKKLKQAEVQRKMQSNLINKNRLRVLQARQTVLNDVFAEAKSRLRTITDDKAGYSALLKGLVLQGLYKLMEPKVTVQCRAEDNDLVRTAIAEAVKEYTSEVKLKTEVVIDEANPLPATSAGGVVLSAVEGRIRTANTLESRLELLEELMLPEIRMQLFGPSPNRKFYT
ncbi:V-ATPase V1 sector subunit E [Polyrhizophydium stewartii]|uniref:V-ATPase V1 sector subunit E n=1 Tax=Polyrhizophydium stewartii TaxID=2732419 RepID=A0ABR4MZC2_9FUNG|nr:V-ATPase V1 sector subunit E [Polyrhizophydium stewartii]